MPRASMATLITYVRGLIYDPNPAVDPLTVVAFTDDQIQQELDHNRFDVFQYRLTAADDIQTTSIIQWHDFYAQDKEYWEDDARLQGPTWANLTPDLAEPMIGHWHFNASQSLPVYVTGKYYDPYAAAVNLMIQYKARLKLQYGYSAGGGSFQRMQRIDMMNGLIKSYRQKMRPRKLKTIRTDTYFSQVPR